MSISFSGASANSYPLSAGLPTTSVGPASKKNDLDSAFADFMKVARETPIERLKDAILKAHGMTSAQYNAMPAGPAKDALTKEIQQAIKKVAAESQANSGNTLQL